MASTKKSPKNTLLSWCGYPHSDAIVKLDSAGREQCLECKITTGGLSRLRFVYDDDMDMDE